MPTHVFTPGMVSGMTKPLPCLSCVVLVRYPLSVLTYLWVDMVVWLKASKASIFLGSIIPLDLLNWRVLLVGWIHCLPRQWVSFGWMRPMIHSRLYNELDRYILQTTWDRELWALLVVGYLTKEAVMSCLICTSFPTYILNTTSCYSMLHPLGFSPLLCSGSDTCI